MVDYDEVLRAARIFAIHMVKWIPLLSNIVSQFVEDTSWWVCPFSFRLKDKVAQATTA